ncbi:MAG: hypothetical protein WC867_07130 [Candidatus Pacearchaeota archaeon]|jgi:hypothetical protein
MVISESELKNILKTRTNIEKSTTISSDGKNLLTRIPKEIADFLEIEKGYKIKWNITRNKKIKMEIVANEI